MEAGLLYKWVPFKLSIQLAVQQVCRNATMPYFRQDRFLNRWQSGQLEAWEPDCLYSWIPV